MARFYQTQLVNPKSAYTPLPYELMADKLKKMQDLQDQYRGQVELLEKPFNFLSNDTELANQLKNDVVTKVDSLRNLDYNNPASRDTIFKTIKDVRRMYDPQGEVGMVEGKFNQYQKYEKEIQDANKDQDYKRAFLLKQLQQEAVSNERRITKDTTGKYINTSVERPMDWNWKDAQDFSSKVLADVAYDTLTKGGWQGTPAEAVSMFQSNEIDSRTKEKIMNALVQRAAGDKDLLMSVTAQGYDQVDDKGNRIDQTGFFDVEKNAFNTNTILGRIFEGTASGGAFKREKKNQQFITDQVAVDKAKHALENAPAIISQQVPPSQFANNYSTTEKIVNEKNNLGQGLRNEWIQLMKENPQIWSKYGIKENNIEQIADAVNGQKGGLAKWINDNKNAFIDPNTGENHAYKLSNLATEYNIVDQLNNEAETYAGKFYNKDTFKKLINESYTAKNHPVLKKMTPDDLNLLYKRDGSNIKTVVDIMNPNDKTLENLGKKYGVSGDEILLAANDFILHDSDKYHKAEKDYSNKKNEYLTQQAKTKQQDNWADSYIPITEPIYDKNGNVTGFKDPSNDKNLKQRSDNINSQIQKAFTSGNLNSILTEEIDENGKKKTLGQVLLEEQILAKEAGSTSTLKPGTPWFSRNPVDASGKKAMYVTIGSRQVPVDMNTIQVNDGTGYKPLKQLNDNPVSRTNDFIGRVYSSGLSNYKIDNAMPNLTITVKTPSALNPNNGGSFANDNGLIVTTNKGEIYKGAAAFELLMLLEQQNALK